MDVGRLRRNSTTFDEDGNIYGVKLGEFREADIQAAITETTRQHHTTFTICMGKTGTAEPYQQSIPVHFARYHKSYLFEEPLTLEGPTGKTWTAVLRNFNNASVRFGRGWRQFSKENHLQEGYQLLFTLKERFRFEVQFFDQLGKRCTSYPPLPSARPGSLPVAETHRQPDLQPGSQSSFHEGLSQVDAGHGSGDMEIRDKELDEAQNDIFYGSDMDEATMKTLEKPGKPERSLRALIELSRGKQPRFHSPDNRAHSPQIQDHNNSPSSGDELSFQYYPKLQKEPVGVKRPRPVATPVANHHEAGGSSGSSRAMRELQQQNCIRFSQIVMNCERRDVSDQERRVVVDAAKRFISAVDDEMFLVVMREEQVHHTFHLAIPEKMLMATGTERKSKVEVCLLDTEEAPYKTHWTRQNFCDTPLLEHDAWAKFAVDHSLEEGDVCVFQLLEYKPSVSMPALVFCVHIFRVVETLVETPVGHRGAARLLRCN